MRAFPFRMIGQRFTLAFTLAFAVTVAVVLAGCATPPPPRQVLPEITFVHEPVLTFQAQTVDVVQEYKPTFAAPQIEHLIAQPPARVAERLVRDRFRLDTAAPNSLRVIVREASVTEQDLTKTPGLRGSFTTDQVARFEVAVAVAVELRDQRGFRVGEASASAKRSNTLSEKATLNDRDRLIHDLVRETMTDLDRELERNLRAYMPLYVR